VPIAVYLGSSEMYREEEGKGEGSKLQVVREEASLPISFSMTVGGGRGDTKVRKSPT